MSRGQELASIRKELAGLPRGNLVYKTISGKKQPYLQWKEGGKTKSRYVKQAERDEVLAQLERRAELRERLNQLERAAELPVSDASPARRTAEASEEDFAPNSIEATDETVFETIVRTGPWLERRIKAVAAWGRRDCYAALERYLERGPRDHACIIYGLRRTGKTTMMRQAIADLPPSKRARAAFVEVLPRNDLSQLQRDLVRLRDRGFVYVFVDEVTLLADFIDNAALFSDVFAMEGMHVVLTGTDSLGFWLAGNEELYDRAVMIHTTHVPYREHARLLGTKDVDDYLAYGGTLRAGEENLSDSSSYDGDGDATFADEESCRRYIDTAIARNIQNSLALYRHGMHFRHLRELYRADELTNAINRVIEDMNHEFVVDVVTRSFSSNDLGSARQLLEHARSEDRRSFALGEIDLASVTDALMRILDLRNRGSQEVEVTPTHMAEIREYLEALDLLAHVEVETTTGPALQRAVFTQPGMRYCQAKALVQALSEDAVFDGLPRREQQLVADTIMGDVAGRMLEDIVLYETQVATRGRFEVFKMQFAAGEFDMVVYDPTENSCDIYEVKHATTANPAQYRHLVNDDLLAQCERKVARIARRCVLYRGEPRSEGPVEYLNVGEYLRML